MAETKRKVYPHTAAKHAIKYPEFVSHREPMIVLLRRGMAILLGKNPHMIDLGGKGAYDKLVKLVEAKPFMLSAGAAALQSMFGHDSGFGTPGMQRDLRAVMVAVTVLDKHGQEMAAQAPPPKPVTDEDEFDIPED